MSRIAVIYYSATGHVDKLAEAVAKGAADAGAKVKLRRVAELASEEVVRRQDAWQEQREASDGVVEEAELEDLEWADGFAFGTPTRYGLPAAQLKAFIDQTGPLWVDGRLSHKVATSFTSSANAHGGQESTLLAVNNVFYHWGCLIVPPGYTQPVLYAAGGNPYGTSYASGIDDSSVRVQASEAANDQSRGDVAGGDPLGAPSPLGVDDSSVSGQALTAAHYQGYRLAQYANRLVAGPAGPSPGSNGIRQSQNPHAFDAYSPPHYSRFTWQEAVASP